MSHSYTDQDIQSFEGPIPGNATLIQSRAIQYLLSKIRSKDTQTKEFMEFTDRLMRIMAEETLCRLPSVQQGSICTPNGETQGLVDTHLMDVCLVSVVRSGDILMEAIRQLRPGVKVGKILIQREEGSSTKPKANFFYKKFPPNISDCFVILLDPMLATAITIKLAIEVLIKDGVKPSNILFLNIVCCPSGLAELGLCYPEVRILTAAIDRGLDDKFYIVPGIGDFGDRYYGTTSLN